MEAITSSTTETLMTTVNVDEILNRESSTKGIFHVGIVSMRPTKTLLNNIIHEYAIYQDFIFIFLISQSDSINDIDETWGSFDTTLKEEWSTNRRKRASKSTRIEFFK